ncbi:MAG: hypothetical protein SV910_08640 [Chloroflexota bacterium]|nr:hypothetical protein [Chloroflexota bacterium]
MTPQQKRASTSPRKRGRRATPAADNSFYKQALGEAERVLLPQAMEIEGLDQEIALLRVKLATALAEHPENLPLLMRGIDLLVKAVAARYRLSRKSQDNLAQAIDGVLKEVGAALFDTEVSL